MSPDRKKFHTTKGNDDNVSKSEKTLDTKKEDDVKAVKVKKPYLVSKLVLSL